MILFGWNSYKLATIQPHELGFQQSGDDLKIEHRQKYFHLFFIPVFPLGRTWVVRKAGKLYEPNPQIKQHLESLQLGNKNTIWAWSGIFLVIGAYFIYSIGSTVNARVDSRNAKNRSVANATALVSFFKNNKDNSALASKIHTINYYVDSTSNEDTYDKDKIDTSRQGLIKLFLTMLQTRQDSLLGYSNYNTLVFSLIDHKRNLSLQIDDEIKKALESGEWKGYGDSAHVFTTIKNLKNYQYLLLVKEYNRLNPVLTNKGFKSGLALADAAIINLETKEVEHRFKLMAANSDSISHFAFSGSGGRVSAYQLQNSLENNLNINLLTKATNYVFNEMPLKYARR